MDCDVLISLPKAAEILGFSRWTGYRLLNSGDFPVPTVVVGKRKKVRLSDLESHLRERCSNGDNTATCSLPVKWREN
ncbi:MAG: helix-turn-helix transcriptional regulator [Gloeomargaritales cyanobacterium]